MLLWIRDALQRIEMQDGVFGGAILRNPQGLNEPTPIHGGDESSGDFGLMQNGGYNFGDIE